MPRLDTDQLSVCLYKTSDAIPTYFPRNEQTEVNGVNFPNSILMSVGMLPSDYRYAHIKVP